MANQSTTTFLTGSTGFIGQYVLRGLLDGGQRVIVLLRGPAAQSRLRLAALLAPLGVDVAQHIHEGHLTIMEGTLPDALPVVTVGRVDRIVHSAACLQTVNADEGEPFATNVEGVKTLARWADAHDVPVFHFVSTAYTCGRDMALAREVFHTPQPRFVTDYELSKWQAEEFLLNWAARSGRRLTILRPALVVGDSTTGFTTQYGGFYQVARVVEMMAEFFSDQRRTGELCLPLRIAADPSGSQNFVPVDYVARAIVEIVERDTNTHQIYHLTNPAPPSNDEVRRWLEDYYQVRGGHFVDRVDTTTSESLAERMFLEMNDVILQQFKFVPEFDCTHTTEVLRGTGVSFPTLDRAMAFRLLDFARAHKWGRQRKAAAS